MNKGRLVVTNVEKYMSEKAVASLWVVAYMAVCLLHEYLSHVGLY